MIERETLPFDEVVVAASRAAIAGPAGASPHTPCPDPARAGQLRTAFEASPGPVRRGLAVLSSPSGPPLGPSRATGALRHWLVQLQLVRATAPFHRNPLVGVEAARR